MYIYTYSELDRQADRHACMHQPETHPPKVIAGRVVFMNLRRPLL